MNVFLDTEFSKLPWEEGSELLSLGIYTENNLSYYACKKDFDENNISDFVKENVLKYLDPESQRKTNIQITNDITELFKDYSSLVFWTQQPTIEWIKNFGHSNFEAQEIIEKYGDWDFQLFKKLWTNLPKKFDTECKNITPLLSRKPPEELPKNNLLHNALADAKWIFEVWKLENKD